MAKTLLQIVKNTLEAMDSDVVDSIYLADGGTEESEQIAGFAKQLYEYLYSIMEWPHSKLLTQLDAVADSSKPNYLKIPETVNEVVWLRYRDKDVQWLSPYEFMTLCDARNSSDTDVTEVTGFEGNTIKVRTDVAPTYYTSFDNEYLVFDSYDSTLDTTLQNSQTDAYCVRSATFTISDTFQPDMPDSMYPLFQAELNREAHLRLKQTDSPVDAKRALSSWSKQRTKVDKVNKQRIRGFGRK